MPVAVDVLDRSTWVETALHMAVVKSRDSASMWCVGFTLVLSEHGARGLVAQ